MTKRWQGHKPGDHLAVCDIDGKVHWRSEMELDWDGSLRFKDNLDGKHPDYEYRLLPMERAPDYIAGPNDDVAYVSAAPSTVGTTSVPVGGDRIKVEN